MIKIKYITVFLVSFFLLLQELVVCDIYNTILSSQVAIKKNLEIIANNIANSATTGYESDYLMYSSNSKYHNSIINYKIYRSKSRGALIHTNKKFDLALKGEGYFKIISPRGIRYTLNGSFSINNEGFLVDSNGYYVASYIGKKIFIGSLNKTISINHSGKIFVDNHLVDIIGVFGFQDSNKLIKEGNNLYYSNSADILLKNYVIVVGALISSNVDSSQATVNLIKIENLYKNNTEILNAMAEIDKNTLVKLIK